MLSLFLTNVLAVLVHDLLDELVHNLLNESIYDDIGLVSHPGPHGTLTTLGDVDGRPAARVELLSSAGCAPGRRPPGVVVWRVRWGEALPGRRDEHLVPGGSVPTGGGPGVGGQDVVVLDVLLVAFLRCHDLHRDRYNQG